MHWHIRSFEQYKQDWLNAKEDPSQFWGSVAKTFSWHHEWEKVTSGSINEANVKWFEGGKLNITENYSIIIFLYFITCLELLNKCLCLF